MIAEKLIRSIATAAKSTTTTSTTTSTMEFRKKFILPKNRIAGSNVNRWFPTHMYVSMKRMQSKLRSVDCIVEVHDARIPFSGRNEEFRQSLYSIRPHILVLNKCDLIDETLRPSIETKLREREHRGDLKEIVWTNCKLRRGDAIRQLMNVINTSLATSTRFNRATRTDYSLMVIGIPNVGKSSLVNAIRNHSGLSSAATVGARPGVTRAVQEKVRIQQSPLIYMLDTPGVVAPHIADVEVGMKMALCETVLQHLVGWDLIADYLLYKMNQRRDFRYLQLTDLTEPTEDVTKLLFEIAFKNKLITEQRAPDESNRKKTVANLEEAAVMFLKQFRSGKFGCQFMDRDILEQ